MREDRRWRESFGSLALFVLSAWPAWVVSVPPLQDLPNHLATAFIQSHLDRYPELVSNGFLKTNSTLFLFLHLASRFVSLRLAAKLFVTLTCAVAAFAYPRALRALGTPSGIAKRGGNVHSACFLIWPFVHNWFVAMGMLDYALSIPLVLLVLVEIRARQVTRPIVAAILAVLVWYTHAFGVVMLGMLVALEIVSTKKWKDASWLLLPLAPSFVLLAISIAAQLDRETRAGPSVVFQTAPGLLYGAWSEFLWSLSKWTATSIACAIGLAWFGAKYFRERRPFFSPLAMGALVILYVSVPYQWHHWYFVCSRILPFVWFGFALRVPDLSRPVKLAFGGLAIAFSVGLGVEYMQNARVWDAFSRGEVAVPDASQSGKPSRLLPMIFDRKGPHGDNTWPMPHAWGLYVIDRAASAPLVFAHSKSFPVSYAVEPPPRFQGITLEYFPQRMRSPETFCAEVHAQHIALDCTRDYENAWRDFWNDATPRFDRVVMYGVTREARAQIPATFRVLFEEDETLVLSTK